MQYTKLDAFFHLACQGDQEAYQTLYVNFIERAHEAIRVTVKTYSKLREFTGDFSEAIDLLFFRLINEYDSTKGSFTWFAEYLFKTRFIPKVKEYLISGQYFLQLNSPDDDCAFYDFLPDPYGEPLATTLVKNEFVYKIASKTRNKSNEERIQDKILLLQYAGYSQTEISALMNMSLSKLRRILAKLKNNDAIINLKLDLK